MVRFSIILLFLATLLYACEECEPEETKCKGDKVYLCYSDGQWEKIEDCDDIWGPEEDSVWTCDENALGEDEAGCILIDGGV